MSTDNNKPPNYINDEEWVLQSPKSGCYMHLQLEQWHGKVAREIMAEIAEAMNETWEQQRNTEGPSKRYELDPYARFDGASDHADMKLSENGDWVSYQDYKEQVDRVKQLGAKLAKAVGVLEKIAQHDMQHWAITTLAELKGEDRG
jgi:hypothetical protein